MKKIISVAVCFLIVLLFPLLATGQKETITVICDNYPYKEGLNTSWGFSCLIKGLEKTILFDTGVSGTILLANMTKLGIHPEDIDLVVLSHDHDDHVGGLPGFLEKYHDVTVYFPNTFFLAGFKYNV